MSEEENIENQAAMGTWQWANDETHLLNLSAKLNNGKQILRNLPTCLRKASAEQGRTGKQKTEIAHGRKEQEKVST